LKIQRSSENSEKDVAIATSRDYEWRSPFTTSLAEIGTIEHLICHTLELVLVGCFRNGMRTTEKTTECCAVRVVGAPKSMYYMSGTAVPPIS
jgi:hypothetical protein